MNSMLRVSGILVERIWNGIPIEAFSNFDKVVFHRKFGGWALAFDDGGLVVEGCAQFCSSWNGIAVLHCCTSEENNVDAALRGEGGTWMNAGDGVHQRVAIFEHWSQVHRLLRWHLVHSFCVRWIGWTYLETPEKIHDAGFHFDLRESHPNALSGPQSVRHPVEQHFYDSITLKPVHRTKRIE